jgi:hypothetical protein
MIAEMKADNAQQWICTKYGVTILAADPAAFCARRYAAANHKDAERISFSRCHICTRGATAFKRAKRKGMVMPENRIASSRS